MGHGLLRLCALGTRRLGVACLRRGTRQRSRAEEVLHEDLGQFLLAVHDTVDALWEWDIATGETWWSPRFKELLGYEEGELSGAVETWQSLLHPDDRKPTEQALRLHLEEDRPYGVEFRLKTKNAGYHWFLAHGMAVRDKTGTAYRMAGSVQDIMERKEVEQSLQLAQFAVDHNSDATYWVSSDGRITYANPAACRALGYSYEELVSMTLPDIDPDLPQEDWLTHWQKLKEAGSMTYEGLQETKTGSVFPVEILANYLEFNSHKSICLYVRDITQRKEADKERTRLVTAVEQAVEVIIITDTEGVIQYVNPAFERLTGYSREEAVGANPRVLKSGLQDESFYQHLWETICRGEVWSGRFINKKKNGSLFKEEATISPILDERGKIVNFVAVKRDITHETNLEDQLRRSQKLEAIGTLAGGIAHDFNNILSAILGFADLAMHDMPRDHEAYECLEEVVKAGERAADLVKQILVFSRQTEPELRPIRVQSIVKEALKLLRGSLPSTIEIRWDIDDNCDPILGGPTQIHQVFMNLATNAYHAMRGHGGVLHVSLHQVNVDAELTEKPPELAAGKYVRLSVEDTGAGIDETTMKRIFEPFFTTKDVGEGTGMGLSIVHGIVTSLHGAVAVDSEPGKGSTFSVFLPCYVSAPLEDRPAAKPVLRGSERILFVDDEAPLAHLGQVALEQLGYQVTARTSSIEALAAFREHPDDFDLVITDQTMPNMTGLELAREILQIRPNIPVIVATGYSETITSEEDKRLGIRERVMKPIAISELSEIIRRHLDK